MGRTVSNHEELEDKIMQLLSQAPMSRKVLDSETGQYTRHALARLSKLRAIEFNGVWRVTGKAYRVTCLQCNESALAWCIDGKGVCHVCRQSGKMHRKPSATNKEMYREFDEAAPFNRFLRLPFGLSSAHYEACLNRN